MSSHSYHFDRRDLARVAGAPLLALAVFALLAHGAAFLHAWPPARPTLDTDRTILIHQFEASAAQPAQLLLIGDSSCLMDISAPQLEQRLGRRVLNLGTLSYLDLQTYAVLLQRCAQANPGRLRTVVLLLHPEALRRPSPEAYYVRLFQGLVQGEAPPPDAGFHGQLLKLSGLALLRDRCLARWVPTPLPGAFGRQYGFSADLEHYLTLHQGSLVEPEAQPSTGKAEYRLAKSWQQSSRVFKAAVPPDCQLLVGITPAPQTVVPPAYPQQYQSMLTQLSQWLQADATLGDLPPTLPASLFAKTTHLNQPGLELYTTLLASNLMRLGPAGILP